MPLSPGTRLGHYDVTTLIGEGGMGQVWQATDTQLNRQGAEGTRALVLELVEGPTLADRIAKGPIPLDEALPIAKQIADALEAAHEAGVIHRDLKPANIKVREDGAVKVLDFGLAKAFEVDTANAPADSPTISLTAAATQMGVIIGTAAYMAPEQARGKPVDKRADIWAFGAVLYEMLSGQRAFAGDDVAQILAQVIEREPDFATLPTRTPAGVRRLLTRCLAKAPRERLRDIGDTRADLSTAESPVPPPDEAFTATKACRIDSARWQPRAGAVAPELSPDGRQVAFSSVDGTLMVMPVAGGSPRELGTPGLAPAARGRIGAPLDLRWTAQDTIMVGREGGGLVNISVDSGVITPVTDVDTASGELGHTMPEPLPDTDAVLFTVWSGQPDTTRIAVQGGDTDMHRMLMAGSTPRYVPTGHIVFVGPDGDLWGVRFDIDDLRLVGDPAKIRELSAPAFDVSAATLIVPPPFLSDAPRLVWVDRTGDVSPAVDAPQRYKFPRWSPDGRRVAFFYGRGVPANSELRLAAVDGSGETELMLAVAGISTPQSWTPDGETLTFIHGERPGEWDIGAVRLGEAPFDVLVSQYSTGNHDLSPDGRWLLYTSNETGRLEMYMGPFSNPDAKVPVLNFDVSPDGERFLMVQSSEATSPSGDFRVVLNWQSELERLLPSQ